MTVSLVDTGDVMAVGLAVVLAVSLPVEADVATVIGACEVRDETP